MRQKISLVAFVILDTYYMWSKREKNKIQWKLSKYPHKPSRMPEIFYKVHILRNLQKYSNCSDVTKHCQRKLGDMFFQFCGLLRIYEL